MVKITNNSYMEIKSHYDDVLNKDRALNLVMMSYSNKMYRRND